jgi:hypothetical protein
MNGEPLRMTRVQYVVDLPNDTRPTTLAPETRAVLTSSYSHLDLDPGGVTAEELHPEDVQTLSVFPVGSDVLVESADPADCLDDTDEESAARTRIWWRVIVQCGTGL